MPVDVNMTYALIVDEDQVSPNNDSDERAWNGGAGLTTFDAALATAVLSIAGADATTDFPTPQLARGRGRHGVLVAEEGLADDLALAAHLARQRPDFCLRIEAMAGTIRCSEIGKIGETGRKIA
jgi:hypothetical protein